MKFEYAVIPHWPRLAWVAECTGDNGSIRVHHGEWVEARDQWFCEAVWAGEFREGGFDVTDIVAGSGARIRDDTVVFVSSGSNLDRLHSFRRGGTTLVSNSVCCLLAWVDGSADLGYRQYEEHFSGYSYSIFGNHSRVFPSSVGPIDVTYFANLLWDGDRLRETEKPCATRRFEHFDDYREFLSESMAGIARNARSTDRLRPFKLLCSLSKGYDSPAVAALAREATDVVEALTFARDRAGQDDSGGSAAAVLGIPCHVIDRDAWRKTNLPEVPFVAGSASVGDLAFKSAESLLGGALLLNGASGAVWKRGTKPSPDLEVGDGALLGLTEYRLGIGFFNCAVPAWGIRQLGDIVRISNSAEMRPWDVGGTYNKPIPRRIVEDAGIARGSFATQKSGVSVAQSARSEYLTPASRKDFLNWLAECRKQSKKSGVTLPSPHMARLIDAVITPPSKLVGWLTGLCNRSALGRVKLLRSVLGRLRRQLRQPYYHYKYMVHWAVDRAKERYVGGNGNH